MSLFNAIFESVINEIKADDAYNRFYSSIPKEDFDRITGGAPDIDKFVQFLLNSVRDGNSSVDDAAEANEAFKSADPLIRQNILNAFRNGEFESAKEVLINIQYLKDGGFVNKNKFAKEGYIKVAENDDWLVTCTTNYMANNHYFGHTKWCTASDRMGRYDGYVMYRRYSEDGESLLMQFTRKGTKDETYQAEIDGIGSGYPTLSTICNIEDEQITTKRLQSIVGDIFEVVGDLDKLQKLLKIQKEQKVHEDKYQEKQTKIIEEKRRRRAGMLERIFAEVEAEVNRRNVPLSEEAERVWKAALSSKCYEDVELLNKLRYIKNNNSYETNFEETYKEAHGLMLQDSANFCYNGFEYKIATMEIGPVLKTWYVKEVYDDNDDVIDYEPAFDGDFQYSARMFIVVETEDDKITNFITSLQHFSGYTFCPSVIQSAVPEYDERFLINMFRMANGENDYRVKGYLFDLKTKNIIPYDKDDDLNWPEDYAPRRLFPLQNGDIIFIPRTTMANHPLSVLMLKSDGSFEFFTGEDTERFMVDSDSTLLYDTETRMISRIDYPKVKSVVVPGDDTIRSIYRASDTNHSVIYIYSKEGSNLLDLDTGEYMFGMWCEDCDMGYSEDTFYADFHGKDGDRRRMKYYRDKNEYHLVRVNRQACDIICDKYGESEEERKKRELGAKNFKDWAAAGGHSPEAKAQMDKMWADREVGKGDGSEAMKAWNDGDKSVLTPEDDRFVYGDFFKKLDPHDDDENWGKDRHGYNFVGLRDPEEFFRTYLGNDWQNMSAYRPGQTYRIRRDGRPLDQPWRDEDEIPARFTDDSLNESVKKVITLMNKLIKD